MFAQLRIPEVPVKKLLNLINAALYAATGILWIGNALEKRSGFYFLLGLIWLIGAVIWIVRYVAERKEAKKEKDYGQAHRSV